jgi:pimeloyl-ACP methyl ester carboxylesterase
VEIRDERVEVAVGSVQVLRGGSGPPLLYLHSASGEGPGAEILSELAESFAVSAPMFPGFGESEGIEAIEDMEDAVFHLLDVLDALALRSASVVGMSLGGWMAAELAARYPDRVERLVLVNPAGLYVPGAEVKEIFGRRLDELALDLFADQAHPMAQLMRQMEQVMQTDPQSVPFEAVRPLLASLAATAKLAWNPYLHDPKLERLLRRVTAPTLVVHGAEDRLIPRDHAVAYAKGIPEARLVDVEGAGHLLALEKPSELAALAKEHLIGGA